MNRAVSLCTAAVLAASVAGCATTSEPTASHAPPPPASAGEIDQDHAYIQQVEQIALRRGIGVTWINPPTKRKARGTN